jgi:inner membrane protein involved in colicin E2 resistance
MPWNRITRSIFEGVGFGIIMIGVVKGVVWGMEYLRQQPEHIHQYVGLSLIVGLCVVLRYCMLADSEKGGGL